MKSIKARTAKTRRVRGRKANKGGRSKRRRAPASKAKPRDIWVFGYGSLMWDPGFPHAEVVPALLRGYHRALCIYSRFHRGTLERPGLVLGLDRGGACRGRAFRVEGSSARAILGYLDERELVSYAYRRQKVSIVLPSGNVPAFAYVADRAHSQYAGNPGVARSVELVAQGVGVSGTCFDYLESAVKHLDGLGIEDGPLHDLLARVIERLRQSMAFDV
ncbi:MAG: gamma-glutamylcyclotransferase [Alphaproteobacteria bacterium]